jgi:hypothetical protein
MTVPSQSSELREKILQYQPENMAEIIEKLAGNKDNIKISVQEVKFRIGKIKYEVSGEVNFNIIHKNSNTHSKAKETE